MVQVQPASLFVLQQQVEVYMNATGGDVYRAISYDNGNHWWPWKKISLSSADSIACAASGNARTRYIVHTGTGSHFSLIKKDEYGYDSGNSQVLGSGVFTSAPSVVCTPDGNTIFCFGMGKDNHYWWAVSRNSGASWQLLWGMLGTGTFKTAPAAVLSADGNTLLVFGLGMDERIWYAQSADGGNHWNVQYGPITNSTFMTPPAACISADGNKVMVVCCGKDHKYYYNESSDKGITWGSFHPIGEGTFNGGPAICCSWDRMYIHIFGVGLDKKMWRAVRNYAGATQWQGWWQMDASLNFLPY